MDAIWFMIGGYNPSDASTVPPMTGYTEVIVKFPKCRLCGKFGGFGGLKLPITQFSGKFDD